MQYSERAGEKEQAARPLSQPQADNRTRNYITYMVVAAWLILVLGKAFGFVTAEIDALLVGSVGVVFGYIYGKAEVSKELTAAIRSAGTSQVPDGR